MTSWKSGLFILRPSKRALGLKEIRRTRGGKEEALSAALFLLCTTACFTPLFALHCSLLRTACSETGSPQNCAALSCRCATARTKTRTCSCSSRSRPRYKHEHTKGQRCENASPLERWSRFMEAGVPGALSPCSAPDAPGAPAAQDGETWFQAIMRMESPKSKGEEPQEPWPCTLIAPNLNLCAPNLNLCAPNLITRPLALVITPRRELKPNCRNQKNLHASSLPPRGA